MHIGDDFQRAAPSCGGGEWPLLRGEWSIADPSAPLSPEGERAAKRFIEAWDVAEWEDEIS